MTDFVLQEYEKRNYYTYQGEKVLSAIKDYAILLKQPLTLGMFVPCDEAGNVLKGKPLSPAPDSEWTRWENEEIEFFKAKDRVLFDFTIDLDTVRFHISRNRTVEYFTAFDEVFLTPNTLKKGN